MTDRQTDRHSQGAISNAAWWRQWELFPQEICRWKNTENHVNVWLSYDQKFACVGVFVARAIYLFCQSSRRMHRRRWYELPRENVFARYLSRNVYTAGCGDDERCKPQVAAAAAAAAARFINFLTRSLIHITGSSLAISTSDFAIMPRL